MGGTLSRDIATTAGHTYEVSFYLAKDPGDSSSLNTFSASFGDGSISVPSVSSVFLYTQFTFAATATAATSSLAFQFANRGGLAYRLDDVSVTDTTPASPVPEPATFATAGLGVLMGLGYAWRRKRAA